MTTMSEKNSADIKLLNSFLKNELSAVETYSQCVDKIDDGDVSAALQNLQRSHIARSQQLDQRIRLLGGEPSDSSGIWGDFAQIMEAGAKLFGENSAMSLLEEGEDKGLKEYQEGVEKLSLDNRSFIVNTILPEQKRSHDQLNAIIDLAKETA